MMNVMVIRAINALKSSPLLGETSLYLSILIYMPLSTHYFEIQSHNSDGEFTFLIHGSCFRTILTKFQKQFLIVKVLQCLDMNYRGSK